MWLFDENRRTETLAHALLPPQGFNDGVLA